MGGAKTRRNSLMGGVERYIFHTLYYYIQR